MQLLEAVGEAVVVVVLDVIEGPDCGLQNVSGLCLHSDANKEELKLKLSAGEGEAYFEKLKVGKVVTFACKLPKVGFHT